jgi:hypothetical protein
MVVSSLILQQGHQLSSTTPLLNKFCLVGKVSYGMLSTEKTLIYRIWNFISPKLLPKITSINSTSFNRLTIDAYIISLVRTDQTQDLGDLERPLLPRRKKTQNKAYHMRPPFMGALSLFLSEFSPLMSRHWLEN